MLVITREVGTKYKDTILFGENNDCSFKLVARCDNTAIIKMRSPEGVFILPNEQYNPEGNYGTDWPADVDVFMERDVCNHQVSAIRIGHDIVVRLLAWPNGQRSRQLRIGIEAPRDINVVREELTIRSVKQTHTPTLSNSTELVVPRNEIEQARVERFKQPLSLMKSWMKRRA